ncbi:MAG: DNRLRE domain-containing protein [Candidatus Sumerlaeota bacterium]|nr:DNRLRE domain-containing protein [Candidatus Sumerlaeota bacterium]
MRTRCATIAVGMLLAVGVGRTARAVDDYLYACGTWQHYSGSQLTKAQCPALRGRLTKSKWADIETSDSVWNWKDLDDQITAAVNQGMYVGVMMHTGMVAPDWLYSNGVPQVMTDDTQGRAGPYPYYLDPEYKVFFKRMIQNLYTHLLSLPSSKRNKILFVQTAFGSTGDVGPYKGNPTDSQYRISNSQWLAYNKEMTSEYYNYFKDTNPKIFLLVNEGNDDSLLPGFDVWCSVNCPSLWRKNGDLNQAYQLNDEIDRIAWFEPALQSRQNGYQVRARAEQSMTALGWWTEASMWNQWTTKLYAMHCGLDIAMHDDTGELTNSAKWPIFEFYNRYAGRKHPEISPGAFCGLRDGLDSSDTTRFPQGTYGTATMSNQTRYTNIAAAFAAYGAAQEDPAAGAGGSMDNRKASGLNDVAWNILKDNYCRYMTQYDPNGTSIGWWRVGPKTSQYGRFARGFQHSTGRDTMCFNIDDLLFGGVPVNGAYPVTINVVYYNSGSGAWELRYDSTTGDKQALSVTKTNDGTWKTASATLTDAYFGNRCLHATDFYLHNTDAEDDIFAFLEAVKPTAASHNVGPWFKADPFAKRYALANVDYWTDAYQQIDLDAFDPNAEPLTFTKQSGPPWLTVSADGDLGGTPGSGDVGDNSFTVRVADAAGLWDEATMTIAVTSHSAPPAPTGLTAAPGDGQVALDWADSAGVAGYNVYRSTTAGGPYTKANTSLLTASQYTDTGRTNGQTYYYVATAVDGEGAESPYSEEASATPTAGGGSGTLTFNPVADAYVSQTNAGSNFGTAAVLRVKTDSGGSGRFSFLRFVVSGVTGTVTSAKLRLYSVGVNMNVTANRVADNLWAEGGITWNNKPSLGTAIASQYAGSSVWVEWDVTSYVSSDGTYSFGMTGDAGSANNDFTSKEGAPEQCPVLEVTFGSPPNQAPSFNSDPFVKSDATQDVEYGDTMAPDASDGDGDALTYSKLSGPAWLHVAANGLLGGTPTNDDVGLNEFTVKVVDGKGGEDVATLRITVINVNDPPLFSANPFQKPDATANRPYSASIASDASDPDTTDTLTFSKVSGPPWLSVADDGALSGTPADADLGLNEFVVEAQDQAGAPSQAAMRITVNPTSGARAWNRY